MEPLPDVETTGGAVLSRPSVPEKESGGDDSNSDGSDGLTSTESAEYTEVCRAEKRSCIRHPVRRDFLRAEERDCRIPVASGSVESEVRGRCDVIRRRVLEYEDARSGEESRPATEDVGESSLPHLPVGGIEQHEI